MQNYKKKLKIANLITLSLITLNITNISGCNNSNYSNTNNYSQYSNYNVSSSLKEYINRVAKRLLIVNDNPQLNQLHVDFCFSNNDKPILSIDYMPKIRYKKNHSITISKGLLNYLQDEAELATIIAIALETLTSNNIASEVHLVATKADRRIINQLYKAGYDPMVLTELQEEYLKNEENSNWLTFLFDPININDKRVSTNKLYTQNNTPRGLQRGKQRYLSNIYLLKR
jgi:predicted Zn-dependent protease